MRPSVHFVYNHSIGVIGIFQYYICRITRSMSPTTKDFNYFRHAHFVYWKKCKTIFMFPKIIQLPVLTPLIIVRNAGAIDTFPSHICRIVFKKTWLLLQVCSNINVSLWGCYRSWYLHDTFANGLKKCNPQHTFISLTLVLTNGDIWKFRCLYHS